MSNKKRQTDVHSTPVKSQSTYQNRLHQSTQKKNERQSINISRNLETTSNVRQSQKHYDSKILTQNSERIHFQSLQMSNEKKGNAKNIRKGIQIESATSLRSELVSINNMTLTEKLKVSTLECKLTPYKRQQSSVTRPIREFDSFVKPMSFLENAQKESKRSSLSAMHRNKQLIDYEKHIRDADKQTTTNNSSRASSIQSTARACQFQSLRDSRLTGQKSILKLQTHQNSLQRARITPRPIAVKIPFKNNNVQRVSTIKNSTSNQNLCTNLNSVKQLHQSVQNIQFFTQGVLQETNASLNIPKNAVSSFNSRKTSAVRMIQKPSIINYKQMLPQSNKKLKQHKDKAQTIRTSQIKIMPKKDSSKSKSVLIEKFQIYQQQQQQKQFNQQSQVEYQMSPSSKKPEIKKCFKHSKRSSNKSMSNDIDLGDQLEMFLDAQRRLVTQEECFEKKESMMTFYQIMQSSKEEESMLQIINRSHQSSQQNQNFPLYMTLPHNMDFVDAINQYQKYSNDVIKKNPQSPKKKGKPSLKSDQSDRKNLEQLQIWLSQKLGASSLDNSLESEQVKVNFSFQQPTQQEIDLARSMIKQQQEQKDKTKLKVYETGNNSITMELKKKYPMPYQQHYQSQQEQLNIITIDSQKHHKIQPKLKAYRQSNVVNNSKKNQLSNSNILQNQPLQTNSQIQYATQQTQNDLNFKKIYLEGIDEDQFMILDNEDSARKSMEMSSSTNAAEGNRKGVFNIFNMCTSRPHNKYFC
ncbi:UNKNOWN [Stylonychia lemnae]|uniref:Uncharacterized protein n=1 Tax=Stylonychia lemnae TaxID=5949 RepID=A0A078AAI3_STYLE|nr:UNKNOWN [Stylonychia lemnae]|eukprot:CDW79285.1 UNKNOWN [Stylonychia lemnae]